MVITYLAIARALELDAVHSRNSQDWFAAAAIYQCAARAAHQRNLPDHPQFCLRPEVQETYRQEGDQLHAKAKELLLRAQALHDQEADRLLTALGFPASLGSVCDRIHQLAKTWEQEHCCPLHRDMAPSDLSPMDTTQ